jgi:hypothetical protein
MSASQDIAILAALLWDKPTLLRSKTPGARAFVRALDPPPHHEDLETEDAPLSIAARAIRFEVSGEPEKALEQYARLEESEGWASVLAGFLIAWSSIPADPAVIDGAVRATRELGIEDDSLRARLTAKLATYALDKGRGDLFSELLIEAADAAPAGSYLRRALRISRANLLDERPLLEEEDFAIPAESDPLVDYPWIDDLALSAARAEVTEFVKTRASSPWSWSIRSGRTPLDEVVAAERQATWAGALWLRNPIRQQLAAQMLSDGAADAYRTLYALTMWVLSGGGDIERIVDFAEPRLDSGSADALVAQVEAQTVIPRIANGALPKVAVALWDLLSPETVDRLLMQLRPTAGPLAVDPEVRHFWGRTALSAPQVWQQRAVELDSPQQAALLEALPSTAIASFERSLAEKFASAGKQAGDALSPAARGALVLVRRRLGKEPTIEGEAVAQITVEVALRDSDALPNEAYETVEGLLREKRREEADAAQKGSMSFGGRTTAADISLVAQARGAIDPATVAELLSEAANGALPPDFRLASLLALARLAATDLAAPEVPPIGERERPHPFQAFMPVSIDLLRAARLAVHARRLELDDQVVVLTLTRHADARVRQIAIETAATFLSVNSSEAIEAALLAGLYDPEERVLIAALGGLRRATLTRISADAVVQRLGRVYQEYGREVRAAAVRAAQARLRTAEDPRLSQIVERGAHDRSWIVRHAALQEDQEE